MGWHPRFDLAHWRTVFPYEWFCKPLHVDATQLDAAREPRKPSGVQISTPADLCRIELVRERVAAKHDLGRAVPSDWFVWAKAQPAHPFLTKIGGVPHREAKRPWPRTWDRTPYTFVAQFCFLDSLDHTGPLPGDLLLVYLREPHAWWAAKGYRFEWSKKDLAEPFRREQIPAECFAVPELSGVIHRTAEYPDRVLDDDDPFEADGHAASYLFPAAQATKIGKETWYIQRDAPVDEDLICTLSSLCLERRWQPWPLVDCERLPDGFEPHGADEFLALDDAGCMYFHRRRADGAILGSGDCY